MPFTHADPAAILRAAQKDELYAEKLRSEVSQLLQQLAGNRLWMKYRKVAEIGAELAYYSLTTLSLNQTLGEEYTGIVQISTGERRLPKKWRLVVMVLLHSIGPVAVNLLLSRFSSWLQSPQAQRKLHPNARSVLQDSVETIKTCLPYLWRFHLAIFYLMGTYYHIAKRLAGVQYVMSSDWFGHPGGTLGFKVLGWLSLSHVALTALYSMLVSWQRHKKHMLEEEPSASSSQECPQRQAATTELGGASEAMLRRCSLCLEQRRHSTATPCGHLFCWDCICQWLRTKHECPLCREKVMPSRVIFLFNYEHPFGEQAGVGV